MLLSPRFWQAVHKAIAGRTARPAARAQLRRCRFRRRAWLLDASGLLGEAPRTTCVRRLSACRKWSGRLAGDDIAIVLLLPSDDAPLAERAVALGQWCENSLAGFGLTAGDRALSSEAMEVLQDLSAIAQIRDSLERSEDGRDRLYGSDGISARSAAAAVHRMRQAAARCRETFPALRTPLRP